MTLLPPPRPDRVGRLATLGAVCIGAAVAGYMLLYVLTGWPA